MKHDMSELTTLDLDHRQKHPNGTDPLMYNSFIYIHCVMGGNPMNASTNERLNWLTGPSEHQLAVLHDAA